jgi:hypothetical protein
MTILALRHIILILALLRHIEEDMEDEERISV